MRIRIAGVSDLSEIALIYNQAVADQTTADRVFVTLEDQRAWLARHPASRYPVLVAEDDGEIRGWSSLSEYRPGRHALRHTAEISYYVHVDHRRKGIGSALLRAAIDLCPAIDIKTLFAILLENNLPSICLLENFGFERWGHLPRVADFDGREVGQFYYGMRIS